MHWYEAEVQALEKKVKNGAIKKGSNLFYGSSSIRLWNSLSEDFTGWHVENMGFGGATLEACVHFFERLVIPAEPKSIIFYAGDNDIGDGKNHIDVMGHFEHLLIKRARFCADIPFTFISIKPSPSRHFYLHRMRELNRYVMERLEDIEGVNYIDVHSKMFTKEGMPEGKFYDEDGLHMNTKGYQLFTNALLQNQARVFRR